MADALQAVILKEVCFIALAIMGARRDLGMMEQDSSLLNLNEQCLLGFLGSASPEKMDLPASKTVAIQVSSLKTKRYPAFPLSILLDVLKSQG